MKHRYYVQFAAWLAIANIVVMPEATATPPVAKDSRELAASLAFRVIDVELDRQGGFSGQLVDVQGQPIADAQVILDNGREQQHFRTDQHGTFRASGLRGGPYRVLLGQQVQLCRVWQAGTAPPSANRALMLVRDDSIALGQNCGSPVACGLVGCREALAHPLIFGGIVAAAIAIPVAIHNADDDDSPAS